MQKTWEPEKEAVYTRRFYDPGVSNRTPSRTFNDVETSSILVDRTAIAFLDASKTSNFALNGHRASLMFQGLQTKENDTLSQEALYSRSRAMHWTRYADKFFFDDLEICIRMPENDWSLGSSAIKEMMNVIREWTVQYNINPVDVGAEFRITRRSRSLFSPAYDNDPYCKDYFLWLEVLGTREIPDWWKFAKKMLERWLALDITKKNIKIHWAKMNTDCWETVMRDHILFNSAEQLKESFRLINKANKSTGANNPNKFKNKMFLDLESRLNPRS